MKTSAYLLAVFRIAQGARADGSNLFDAQILALIEVAFEDRETSLFAFR